MPRWRPDQWAIVSHPARLKVVAAGRRWGKTLMAGSLALACANHGAAVAWVVPTYRNARPVWRLTERLVGHLDGLVRVNRADQLVSFPSQGYLGVYSADNDVAIRGEAFDLVVVDEAAQIAPETFSDVILPTLADRDGRCYLISTPKGLNWFHAEYLAALADGLDRAAWQAPTADNPIPAIQRAAQMAKTRVTERAYQQEWLAAFVSGGQVFRRVREAATATRLSAPIGGHAYVFGIDWGQVNDWTVVSVIDTTTRVQVHLERFNKIDYVLQAGRVAVLAQRFRPRLIIAERNSVGAPVIEQLARYNLPVWGWTATNATKHDLVQSLALAFERGDLTILDDPVQLGELLAYDAERLPSGMLRYAAPEGQHDDCVTALMLAWLGAMAPDGRPITRDFRVEAA